MTDQILTDERFWDCECERHYIHVKTDTYCSLCGARAGDQPDARADEIRKVCLHFNHYATIIAARAGYLHTPLPWKIEERVSQGIFIVGNIPDDYDKTVCSLAWTSPLVPRDVEIADAELIVHACNSHADLLKILKLLLSHPSSDPVDAKDTKDGYFLTPLEIVERKARQLIKNIEEPTCHPS